MEQHHSNKEYRKDKADLGLLLPKDKAYFPICCLGWEKFHIYYKPIEILKQKTSKSLPLLIIIVGLPVLLLKM